MKLAFIEVCSFSISTLAQELFFSVAGSGSHSNGVNGNASAWQATSRAFMGIHSAPLDTTLVDLKDGASVNTIAVDASFKVQLASSVENSKKMLRL